MQGCHFVESHKSAGCGPVRSPETIPAREQENKKANQKQHSKNRKKTLSPCPLELNGILQTPWYQRTLRFFEDGDFLQIYTSTMLHTELATRVTASHRLPGPPHRGELPIAFASDAINRLSLHGFSAQPIGDAARCGEMRRNTSSSASRPGPEMYTSAPTCRR